MQRILLFLISFFFAIASSIAQQDSLAVRYDNENLEVVQISEDDIEEFRNDPKFNYEVVVNKNPTWWDDFKTWIYNLLEQFFELIFGVEKATGALSLFFRILPYVLLALLLFLLIRFFINTNASIGATNYRNKAFIGLSEEEHIIKNEDIQVLIKKALENNNYRLAIRYYYLYILQLMSENEYIDWQLQKTNNDYQNELKNPELKDAFTKVTRLYDYVWYGDFDIDEPQYQKAAIIFSSLQKTLKK